MLWTLVWFLILIFSIALQLFTVVPRDTVYKSVVKDKEYTLKSPNYPGNYPKDKMLYWVLTAADPNDRIKLIFQDFQLALDDSLYVSYPLADDIVYVLKYTCFRMSWWYSKKAHALNVYGFKAHLGHFWQKVWVVDLFLCLHFIIKVWKIYW